MSMTRSELRVKIMTILYQIDIYRQNSIEYDINNVIKENIEIDSEFVKEVVYGVNTYYDELNNIANKHLDSWNINRLDKAGASILRMALYEILYTDTPKIVVINEAVELAKKYSEDAVRKMINAVLDKVSKEQDNG